MILSYLNTGSLVPLVVYQHKSSTMDMYRLSIVEDCWWAFDSFQTVVHLNIKEKSVRCFRTTLYIITQLGLRNIDTVAYVVVFESVVVVLQPKILLQPKDCSSLGESWHIRWYEPPYVATSATSNVTVYFVGISVF